jgi:hypothetical protein
MSATSRAYATSTSTGLVSDLRPIATRAATTVDYGRPWMWRFANPTW